MFDVPYDSPDQAPAVLRTVSRCDVRVSQIVPDAASATPQRFALQEEFLAQLVRALPANARDLLVGDAS